MVNLSQAVWETNGLGLISHVHTFEAAHDPLTWAMWLMWCKTHLEIGADGSWEVVDAWMDDPFQAVRAADRFPCSAWPGKEAVQGTPLANSVIG